MPSKSPAQKRTMGAIAHGWEPPSGSDIDIPVKVAKEFNRADQAKAKGKPVARSSVTFKAKPGSKGFAKAEKKAATQSLANALTQRLRNKNG